MSLYFNYILLGVDVAMHLKLEQLRVWLVSDIVADLQAYISSLLDSQVS